ncbi:MAG: zinc ABC transporter substrate-binding protein [Cytophagales bacterium]|nr:zinc ABC transporter substrate-binding protein [Cytophaga sp.]
MKSLLHISIISILFLLFSCSDQKDTHGSSKRLIVTTTGMIADAVKNLVGDSADVIALMGPGVDPHLYKATKGDLDRLNKADVIVYNGLHLEGKMSEILEKLASKKTVIAMSNGVPVSKLRLLDASAKVYDPHIWFDVALWNQATDYLANQLISRYPTLKTTVDIHHSAYSTKLLTLDTETKTAIACIPKTQRVLITAHDAFGYFGKAYDIEVNGLQGISTVSDFGLNDVTHLVTLISERNIKAVFIETSVSDQSIKAVMDGCRQNGKDVKLGGTLFSDAMGNAGTPEGTYIGMVRKNVETIVSALK